MVDVPSSSPMDIDRVPTSQQAIPKEDVKNTEQRAIGQKMDVTVGKVEAAADAAQQPSLKRPPFKPLVSCVTHLVI